MSLTVRPLPALCCLWAAACLSGCGPLADSRSPVPDLRPPLVQSVESIGPSELRVEFDEEAFLRPEKTTITPALQIGVMAADGPAVVIKASAQVPGQRYLLETEAADARGNSTSFLAEFYGFNGRVPRLLVNEFTPRGSGAHPDSTELKALSDGNLGGVVLYNGTPGSFDGRFIFPACAVRTGSFIVVHWKPSGTDPSVSTGAESSDTALDFWAGDCPGLNGNNGVLSVYERGKEGCPGGRGKPGGVNGDAFPLQDSRRP